MNVKIRKAYDDRVRHQFVSDKPSLTKSYFADECDIDKIMARYQTTGIIEHVNRFQGDYSDLIDVDDFHISVNRVIAAQDAFDSLPSTIRGAFSNDPAEFLAFVQNPDNKEKMIEMGLMKKPFAENPAFLKNAGEKKTLENDNQGE